MKTVDRDAGTVILLAGAVFAAGGLGMLVWELRALRWETAPGTLLEARVASRRNVDGGESYFPRVRYRYEVGGKDYEGKRYSSIDWRTGAKAAVESAIRELEDAQERHGHIQVRHDPARPEESVVAVGASAPSFLFFAFSSPFILVGAATASSGIRKRTVFFGLAAGTAVGGLAAGLHAFLVAPSLSLGAWPVALWAGGAAAGLTVAARRPAFVHAREMAKLAPRPRRGRTTEPAHGGRGARRATMTPSMRKAMRTAFVPAVAFGVFGLFAANMGGDFDVSTFVFFAVFGVFASVLLALVLPLIFRRIASKTADISSRLRNAYEGFAEDVGGQLEWGDGSPGGGTDGVPRAVAFSTDGVPGAIGLAEETGPEDSPFTSVVFRHGRGGGFRCLVRPRGRRPRRHDASGLAEVEMEWDVFGDQLTVLSNEELKARRVLTREIQEGILSLRQPLPEEPLVDRPLRDVHLSIDGSVLELEAQGALTTAGGLSRVHETGVGILRSLLRALDAVAS